MACAPSVVKQSRAGPLILVTQDFAGRTKLRLWGGHQYFS